MGMTTLIFFGLIGLLVVFLLGVAIYDVVQSKHTILRNFPVIGHLRYILEGIGPELRQYIVTNSNQERPFSRNQRRWIYASSKRQNNYYGFGSDTSIELEPNYLIIKHATFAFKPLPREPGALPTIECSKVWGAARGRAKAFRPESTLMISAMSYGSLSAPAVESLKVAPLSVAGLLRDRLFAEVTITVDSPNSRSRSSPATDSGATLSTRPPRSRSSTHTTSC